MRGERRQGSCNGHGRRSDDTLRFQLAHVWLGADPALASGPVTTVTQDLLSIATSFARRHNDPAPAA